MALGAAANIALGSSAVSTLVGLFSGGRARKEARKRAKSAQVRIDNFKFSPLENAFTTTQVSTKGSDLQTDILKTGKATQLQLASQGGNRGVIGSLGTINQNSNIKSRQISADLDQKVRNLELQRAQDEANMRGIQENRQQNELAGLGAQVNNYNQLRAQGSNNLMSGITGALGTASAAFGAGAFK